MPPTWRYCAHCDDWHRTQGHGVACPDHGDVIEFVSDAVLVLPPGIKACPTCLDIDEHDAAGRRSRSRAGLVDLQAFTLRAIDSGLQTMRQQLVDEQQTADMIAEGGPIWRPDP